MDARFHANPPTRLIPSVRTLGVLTLGVCLGVVAEMPIGGGSTLAVVLAVLAAAGAAALVVLRPQHPAAFAAADVLLGLAVVATVFGHLGLLFVPLFLAFLAVTARIERTPERSEEGLHWEPAPEFEGTMPAAVAAPAVVEHELVVQHEVVVIPDPFEEPDMPELGEPFLPDRREEPALGLPDLLADPAASIPDPEPEPLEWLEPDPDAPAWSMPDPEPPAWMDPEPSASTEPRDAPPAPNVDEPTELEPDAHPVAKHHNARHRAPSPARRAAAAAGRAGRRLGEQAKAGASNLRAALASTPPDGAAPVPDPIDEPEPEPQEAVPDRSPNNRPIDADYDKGLDDLRHEFEERELELVAAGKPWSSLTHRAYGELRFLPAPPPKPPSPPRRRRDVPVVRIDDAEWETPTWKTLSDR